MSAEELLAAYPRVQAAVAWVEYIVCGKCPDDPETSWELMMRARLSPAEVVETLRDAAAGDMGPGIPAHKQEAVRREMLDPQFMQYVAGKMGAV